MQCNMQGAYAYIVGTNIEVCISIAGVHTAICSSRVGRRYMPYKKKSKGTQISQEHPLVGTKQEIPYELLGDCAFVKRSTVLSRKFSLPEEYTEMNAVQLRQLRFDEGKWTTARNTHPALIEEQHGDSYRYFQKYVPWIFLNEGCRRVTMLYVHGLRDYGMPILNVRDGVVTFNVKPLAKAHLSVCRVKPTRGYLHSRRHIATIPKAAAGFAYGYLRGTTLKVHAVARRGDKTLCILQKHRLEPLVWVHNKDVGQKRWRTTTTGTTGTTGTICVHGVLTYDTNGDTNGDTTVALSKLGKHIGFARRDTHRDKEKETIEERKIRLMHQNDIQDRHLNKKAQMYLR